MLSQMRPRDRPPTVREARAHAMIAVERAMTEWAGEPPDWSMVSRLIVCQVILFTAEAGKLPLLHDVVCSAMGSALALAFSDNPAGLAAAEAYAAQLEKGEQGQ